MAQDAARKIDESYEAEKQKTAECREDLCVWIQNTNCSTRRQLIALLKEKIKMIQDDIGLDEKMSELLSP
jgi:hypothetical protein